MVEQELLNNSQSFVPSKKKQNFSIERFFDWNELNIEDLLEINKVNVNELYEQWKRNICGKKPCLHQEKIKENQEEEEIKESKDSPPLSCDCDSELNLDMILRRQPTNEIELNEETCSRLNNELSPLPSLNTEPTENHIESKILDKVNDNLTTEILTENNQFLSDKNSRISLFKLDKSTSTDSLSLIVTKQSNIFSDLFIFEKPISRNSNLGKHENWIADAMSSYLHPFHDFSHEQCFIKKE